LFRPGGIAAAVAQFQSPPARTAKRPDATT
jgi:hypothetical protein